VHRACGAQIQLLNDERARALVTDIHKLKVMRSLEECTRWEQRLHELGDVPSSEDEEEEEDRRASKVCGAAPVTGGTRSTCLRAHLTALLSATGHGD
jgi:hypothetical protein